MLAFTTRPALARLRRQLIAMLLVLLAAIAVRAAPLRADEPTLKLRIAWGGGAERAWQGTITLDAGKLADPQPLGLEADEPGSMWLDDAGALVVRQRSPRAYDGVDIEVRADLAAHLLVSLTADGERPGEPVSIELSKLVNDTHDGSLDGRKNRLLVRRVPGDKLRVTVVNPALVFSPGERVMLRVQPHLLGQEAGQPIVVRSQLISARGKHEIFSKDEGLTLPAAGEADIVSPLEFAAPDEPGAYDLVLSALKGPTKDALGALAAPRELLPKFAQRNDTLGERRVQLLVVRDGRGKAEKPGPPPDNELMVINPAKTWWDRVAHLPTIPGMGRDPLEHGRVERWVHPQLGAMVTLGVGTPPDVAKDAASPESNEAWVAYPLSVSQPGQAHVVEVEYPSDVPQAMTLSIVEPNAAGMVIPVGLDSGVVVPTSAAGTPARLERHRLVFWPKTREPLLLISRSEGAARAVHGQIRLLGPKHFGVGGLRLGMDARSELPRSITVAERGKEGRRLVAGLIERPLFPENFGATDVLDTWSGRSLDDWITFQEGGRRLLEYADYVGYNALIVSVLADGSTLYPSRWLTPTPRYDTGAFFSTGQDPVRKDVLEMLLRMADAQGTTIVPLLYFSAPLPQVEAQLRRQDADATGLLLVGGTGATWTDKHGTDRGAAAYYNPLDPRVQEAMRQVVRELVERYGQHPSFGGVALGSGNNCYALLPGPDWGLDDATIARFSGETRRDVPGAGPGRFAARVKSLSGENREAWLNWRAETMHRFHAELLKDITAAHTGAKLIVTTGGMLQGPEAEALLRPTLPARFKLDDLPLAVGLRSDLYQSEEGIVLLRPRLVAAPASRAAQAAGLIADNAPELDRALSGTKSVGNLLLHPPVRSRLATFDARSPFGEDRTYTSLVAHLAPSPLESRRRLVEALAALDAPLLVDGGWMLTLGQEDSLRPLLAAYRRLPASTFQTLPADTQGVIVRTLRADGGTYLCLLNPMPWRARLSATVHGGQGAQLVELSGLRRIAAIQNDRLKLELDPYDLLAVRISIPNDPQVELSLTDVSVELEEKIREQLYQRTRDLVARAAALGEPSPTAVLANPDFERPRTAGRDLTGWTLAGGNAGAAVPDSQQKHGGGLAARLTSQGGVASLISNPFEAPPTGRISFSVWIRSADAMQAPTLRLAIGGKLEGRDYYRFAVAPVRAQWEQFIFQVDNLPLSGLSDLQVRFDLMGAGTVWIDDVSVSNLMFSANERLELSRIITRAHFALEDGKLAECQRQLGGYWPRYLEENAPLPPTNVASNPRPAADPPAEQPAPPVEASPPWWKRGLPGVFR